LIEAEWFDEDDQHTSKLMQFVEAVEEKFTKLFATLQVGDRDLKISSFWRAAMTIVAIIPTCCR